MKMLVASLALLTAALTARATEFEHYQIILDRHPFGALAGANTNIVPDFAKSLRLSAIWVARGQCRAGIEDNTTKLKRDYVLVRGDLPSEDGLELVDVNITDESAVIRKGTETATLHVQAGASTNMPIVNVPGMSAQPGGASSGNPWRDFYERYRQRHQEGGGGSQMVFPMQGGPGVPGGSGGIFQIPGGGTFSVNSSGGAQGQPIGTQMTAPQAVVDQNRFSKFQTKESNSSSGSSKRHYKH